MSLECGHRRDDGQDGVVLRETVRLFPITQT